jgi:hypothetical protein
MMALALLVVKAARVLKMHFVVSTMKELLLGLLHLVPREFLTFTAAFCLQSQHSDR